MRSFVMKMRKEHTFFSYSRKLIAIKPTIRTSKTFWCSGWFDQTAVLKRGVKAKVFAEKSRKIHETKAVIKQKIEEIPQEMIEQVMENFRKRL